MFRFNFYFCLVSIFSCASYCVSGQEYKFYDALPDHLYSPWTSDPIFLEINGNAALSGSDSRWGPQTRYLQYVLSRHALSVEGGDFIECGVLHGKSFDIFARVLDRWDTQKRSIYGFDSFEGLSAPTNEDLNPLTAKHAFSAGSVRGWQKEHIEKLLTYHRCHFKLVKAWIPAGFVGFEEKRFSFAHIDVDLYQATKDSLDFVYPRMLKGGIILFDDYGFPGCFGAKKAVDDYLADKPELIIVSITGQAYIIKQ